MNGISFEPAPLWIVVPLATLAVVGGWWVVLTLVARLGGWAALGERYRAQDAPADATLRRWQRGMVGWVSYDNVLTVGVSSRGLYLAVVAPLSLAHPPLLLPWTEIRSARQSRVFFMRLVRLEIGRDRPVIVRLRPGALVGAPLGALDRPA